MSGNDGQDIMERLKIAAGPGVWAFDDCLVVESENGGFDVYMETYNRGIFTQHVESRDMDAKRRMLDEGCSPMDGWVDANGCSINTANAVPVEGEGEYIVEAGAGKDRFFRDFADPYEAVIFAEHKWKGLGKAYQDIFLKTRGAYFRVAYRDGEAIYDCIENARRAIQRKSDAKRAKKEPAYLTEWANDLHRRMSISKTYECGYLFEGGWNGSETVFKLMEECGEFGEEANDTLDYLAMLAVQRELEGRQ